MYQNQKQEIKSAETQRHETYNMAKDIERSSRQREDAFWRKQWDEILYPDWT